MTGAQMILFAEIGLRLADRFAQFAAIAQRVKDGKEITDKELETLAAESDTKVDRWKAAGKHDRKGE